MWVKTSSCVVGAGCLIVLACLSAAAASPASGAEVAAAARSGAAAAIPAPRSAVDANYGNLPISFEANRGQSDKRVHFLARGRGYELFLTPREAVLSLQAPRPEQVRMNADRTPAHRTPAGTADVIRMQLLGANSAPSSTGVNLLPGTVNYLTGGEPSGWHTGVPTYASVKFSEVYPGVDLIYYGNQSQLEYDFVVAPEADPHRIHLRFAGASALRLTAAGDLSVSVHGSQIALHKPIVYQQVNGRRQPVSAQFALAAHHKVAFSLGHYDRSLPLIIDPVLVYSTYLGGTVQNEANAIAADSAGNAYITGATQSSNFPVTSHAYLTTGGGVFVTKLNPSGTAAVYSTLLGGTFGDIGAGVGLGGIGYDPLGGIGIAVDAAGNAYVTGNDGGVPATPGAYSSGGSIFVTKLNPTGTALVYSAVVGSPGDNPGGIALNSAGDAFVTGTTSSVDFPVTPGAYQTENRNQYGSSNAFVTVLNSTGSGLVYSTYLGGSGKPGTGVGNALNQYSTGDSGMGIAVDSQSTAYVTGATYSTDFPVTNGAYQTTNKAAALITTNAFITHLNANGSALLYSTYLGGSGATSSFGLAGCCGGPWGDYADGIAVDGSASAYVTGVAASFDFPTTPGSFSTTGGGSFVTKLSPNGETLAYSTLINGSAADGIALDSAGDAYITGVADSIPVTPGAFQSSDDTTTNAFVTELDPTGTSLLYSTYLGGSGFSGIVAFGDEANGIAVDSSGNAYIAGYASSFNFPVTPGAFQTMNTAVPAPLDEQASYYTPTGFVAKLALRNPTETSPTSTTIIPPGGNYDNVVPQGSIAPDEPFGVPLTYTAIASGNAPNNASPTGNMYFYLNGGHVATVPLNAGSASYTTSSLNFGQSTIQAIYGGDANFAVSDAVAIQGIIPATPNFSPGGGRFLGSVTVTLTSTPDTTIYYTTDGSLPNAGSPVYTVPITLTAPNTMLRAIAGPRGQGTTEVTQTYQFYYVEAQAPTPVLSLAGGAYPAGQRLTISDAIPTATIRYTTDGSVPNAHSHWYDGPIVLNASETINAIAISTGLPSSNVASATYTVP